MILGDCLEKMKDIPDKSINMILADLPYGTTKAKWDSVIDLVLLWGQYKRIIKDDGIILLFAQTPFDKILGASNLDMLRYEWIWQKTHPTGHLNAKKMPMKAHENILVFYKKLPKYFPKKTQGHKRKTSTKKHKENTVNNQSELYGKSDKFSTYDSTERYPISVLKFPSDKQTLNLHPTQKPVGILTYFIETHTEEGDIVLDNVAGAFSTAIACIDTNRQFIMMENDPEIFEKGRNRVIAHLSSKAK